LNVKFLCTKTCCYVEVLHIMWN